MATRPVIERRRDQLASAIKISEAAAIEHGGNAFVKSERDVERNFENYLCVVIDEAAFVADRDRGQSLAEVFSVRELHRDDELAGLIDVTPFAGIGNQADVRDSLFAEIDRAQTF